LRGAVSKLHQQKTRFLLSIKEVSSGRLTIPPCCIQREADELAALIFAVFAVKTSLPKQKNECLFEESDCHIAERELK
jgi:hypothetical protein